MTWYGPTCERCGIDILDGTLCDFCEEDEARALAQGEARMLDGPSNDPDERRFDPANDCLCGGLCDSGEPCPELYL